MENLPYFKKNRTPNTFYKHKDLSRWWNGTDLLCCHKEFIESCESCVTVQKKNVNIKENLLNLAKKDNALIKSVNYKNIDKPIKDMKVVYRSGTKITFTCKCGEEDTKTAYAIFNNGKLMCRSCCRTDEHGKHFNRKWDKDLIWKNFIYIIFWWNIYKQNGKGEWGIPPHKYRGTHYHRFEDACSKFNILWISLVSKINPNIYKTHFNNYPIDRVKILLADCYLKNGVGGLTIQNINVHLKEHDGRNFWRNKAYFRLFGRCGGRRALGEGPYVKFKETRGDWLKKGKYPQRVCIEILKDKYPQIENEYDIYLTQNFWRECKTAEEIVKYHIDVDKINRQLEKNGTSSMLDHTCIDTQIMAQIHRKGKNIFWLRKILGFPVLKKNQSAGWDGNVYKSSYESCFANIFFILGIQFEYDVQYPNNFYTHYGYKRSKCGPGYSFDFKFYGDKIKDYVCVEIFGLDSDKYKIKQERKIQYHKKYTNHFLNIDIDVLKNTKGLKNTSKVLKMLGPYIKNISEQNFTEKKEEKITPEFLNDWKKIFNKKHLDAKKRVELREKYLPPLIEYINTLPNDYCYNGKMYIDHNKSLGRNHRPFWHYYKDIIPEWNNFIDTVADVYIYAQKNKIPINNTPKVWGAPLKQTYKNLEKYKQFIISKSRVPKGRFGLSVKLRIDHNNLSDEQRREANLYSWLISFKRTAKIEIKKYIMSEINKYISINLK